jgi:periplasmic protein TonB
VSRLRSQAAWPPLRHVGRADGVATPGACVAETASAPDLSLDGAFDPTAIVDPSIGVSEPPSLDVSVAAQAPADAAGLSAPLIKVDVLRAREDGRPTPGDGPFALNASPGLAVVLDSETPLGSRWAPPLEALAVLLAHVAALIALLTLGAPLPPAPETIEVTVVAAGDEALVTGRAASTAEHGDTARESKPPQQTQDAEAGAPTSPASPEMAPSVAATQETPPTVAEQKRAPPPESSPPEAPPPMEEAEKTQWPPLPPEPAPPQNPPPGAAPTPRPSPRVESPLRPKPEAKSAAVERPKPLKAAAPKGSAARSNAAEAKSGGSEAHQVGTAVARPVEAGGSRASYAALVISEIQAHRYYPEPARERSEQGAVGISFTIGPSGRVASAAVVRPSGFADLDDAARAIVRSIAPPPPPGGSFSASTTIRFHVE